MDRDPDSGTDRLSSAMLEFPNGQATFTCSTQLVNGQRVHVHGTKGRIEVAVPVNAPPDRATRIAIDTGADLFGSSARFEDFPAVNQYTIQGDLFSQAVRNGSEVPSPLEDGIANMAVIDAVVLAAHSGRWEPVETRL
jgi:predicted dehydrogenase